VGNVSVEVVNVDKRFRRYENKHQSFKERLVHAGRATYEDFWALRNVNFEVLEGETVGILGRNGSGKSTLLKCISGILQPTEGHVLVRGQLAALLELGAGFQTELSGRDNIYLNASLLGLSSREVDKRYDEIVAFAELESFIDTQVKFYSSGMYVRLGFAVAVNVDPDVLVVDEVLAVGDENFQRKCLKRIREFQDEGRTILFVTHAPDLVRQVCDRCVVLSNGRVVGMGTPGEAIRLYREHLLEEGPTTDVPAATAATPQGFMLAHGERPIHITGTDVTYPDAVRQHLLPGEPLGIKIRYDASEPVADVVGSIAIYDLEGKLVFGTDTEIMERDIDVASGPGQLDFRFGAVPLLDGTYMVNVGLRSRNGGVVYDWREQGARFEVLNPGRTTGAVALDVEVDVVRAGSASPSVGGAPPAGLSASVGPSAPSGLPASGGPSGSPGPVAPGTVTG
jgi:ABC-type polysaccharide/polyol phosphate transport system ATPase subunit